VNRAHGVALKALAASLKNMSMFLSARMSNSSVFQQLLNHFQGEADKLAAAVKGSSAFPNASDKGSNRELVLEKFLSRHIPTRCKTVRGGYAFNHDGLQSKQIDVIVTNDATLQFENEEVGGKSFNSVEGCNSVISVKSFLDKKELIDCIDNLSSLPTISNLVVSREVSNPEEMISQMPQRIVFAYDGLEPKTIYDHMRDYSNEKKLAGTQLPSFIVVNNKYYIEVIGSKGVPTIDGQVLRNTVNAWVKNNPYFGGLTLLRMLVRIQLVSTFSPYVILDWEPYIAGMAKFAEQYAHK
jgi:hypothetical protein